MKPVIKHIIKLSLLIIFICSIIVLSSIVLADNSEVTAPESLTEEGIADHSQFYNAQEKEYRAISQVQPVTEGFQTQDLQVAGWIPDWDLQDGYETIQAQQERFDSVSPVWFWMNEDGSLDVQDGANNAEFITWTQNNNIELIPTITLFDPDILHSVLNNEEYYERHMNDIISQVVENNYDGIDLDYESTYVADKEEFFALLEDLQIRLGEIDKKLIFTALPKWGDKFIYPYLPQTRRVQDYGRIAEYVDEFRIMTYELTGRNSNQVGPVAPRNWMEDVVKFAIYDGVPQDKIMLGIHTYSYDYSERPIRDAVFDDYYYVEPEIDENLETGFALFNNNIEGIFENYEVTVEYNETWQEALGFYEFEGNNRILIYPTQESIEARKELASEYGLRGVVYWRIGDDGDFMY